jgi:hypothetical protein
MKQWLVKEEWGLDGKKWTSKGKSRDRMGKIELANERLGLGWETVGWKMRE